MSRDPETRQETGAMDLVGGIIADVHDLIQQQMALFQHEIKGEVAHAREAGSLVAAGLAFFAIGGVLLGGMLVHLLARIAPALPLWGCYGIVGAPLASLGAILCLAGIQRFRYFNTAIGELAQDLKERADG